jgi:glycerophosphoryl diester phosphodiesterase
MRCRVFGHGSGSAGDELNSRASFDRVRKVGCDGVELDIRRTLDDRLAVIHDPSLADGRDVAQTASHELPGDVMLLEGALDLFQGMSVNIEIKNYRGDPHWDPEQRVVALLIALLASRPGRDDVILSSFGIECLDEIRLADSRYETALLLLSRRPATQLLDTAVAHGHRRIHPYDTMVDRVFIAEASARGLNVTAWTAEDDSEFRLRQLIGLGVNGLITGAPELATRLLSEAPTTLREL